MSSGNSPQSSCLIPYRGFGKLHNMMVIPVKRNVIWRPNFDSIAHMRIIRQGDRRRELRVIVPELAVVLPPAPGAGRVGHKPYGWLSLSWLSLSGYLINSTKRPAPIVRVQVPGFIVPGSAIRVYQPGFISPGARVRVRRLGPQTKRPESLLRPLAS